MTVQEHRFPCDQCGADMRFDPGAEQLICDFCGNTKAIEKGNYKGQGIHELDFEAAIRDKLPSAEIEITRTVDCHNCGANFEFDSAIHAAECPFCATPVVTDTGPHRQIKPKGVVPFVLTEPKAHDEMNAWLGSLWFAPNGLKEYARKGRKMSGIYVPYWTYDADTKSRYTGQRGTDYYVSKTVIVDGKPKTVQERRTRWKSVSGRVARFFDDVLVLASKSLPKKYTDALEPWTLSALQPYSADFLAGFRAEGYQIELDEGYKEARMIMDATIQRDIKFDIGGDRQRIQSVDTDINDVTFKHILLPIWLAAYKYRGKSYRFVVNGQTGKVQGERPYSAWKIAFAVIAGLIVAAVIGYFAAQAQ